MAGRASMLVPMVLILLAIGRPSVSIKASADSSGDKNVTEGALVKGVEDEQDEEGRRLGWGGLSGGGHCSSRIEHALASISSRKSGKRRSTTLDLSGYALRQSLRSAPFDMYVTNMKVKGPGGGGGVASWARVHDCRYDPTARTLQTKLIFTDFAISGSVKLFDDQRVGGSVLNSGKPPPSLHYYHPQHHVHHHHHYSDDNRRYGHPSQGYPVYNQYLQHNNIHQYGPESGDEGWGREGCNMSLRMRRAGLRFTVLPTTAPPDVRILAPGTLPSDLTSIGIATATSFLEPQFISVHAYGCQSPEFIGLRWIDGSEDNRKAEEEELKNRADLMAQEMEQVFFRGVRSLLSQYMEAQLEPALRDTLMLNLGYSVSYGKKKRR